MMSAWKANIMTLSWMSIALSCECTDTSILSIQSLLTSRIFTFNLHTSLRTWSKLRQNCGLQYRNQDFGELRMTVLWHYRGSTNFLDVVRGIVWVWKLLWKVHKTFRVTTRTDISYNLNLRMLTCSVHVHRPIPMVNPLLTIGNSLKKQESLYKVLMPVLTPI